MGGVSLSISPLCLDLCSELEATLGSVNQRIEADRWRLGSVFVVCVRSGSLAGISEEGRTSPF